MERKKILLWSSVIGAALGARVATGKLDLPEGDSPLALDHALHGYRAFLVAAVFLWAVFGVYWEAEAKKASAAKSSESKSSRFVHVFCVNIALLVEIAPIRGLGRVMPPMFSVMSLGLAIELAGLALAIWARRHLGRHWSGEITVKVDHELIRSGPYRRLRHPIYTGLLAMYVGMAIVTGEWLGAIGLAIAVLAYWRKIRMEEAALDTAFGAAYDSYRRSSWALVPGVY